MKRSQRWGIVLILVGLVGLVTMGCLTLFEAPGKGAKAEAGYQACEPLIRALEQYRQQKNAYPAALAQLVPDVLPVIPPEVDNLGITYTRKEASYTLRFSYTGPGMNHCDYVPEKGWNCFGYY